jgi:uncharacterized iron-regulated membrane protein
MPSSVNARLRRLWLNIHLCIGIGLAVLLIPISLSGALLVWSDHVDALVNPGRYAVTVGQPQPPSVLLASATAALGPGFQPIAVRMPESAGWPASVTAREQRRGERTGARPRLLTVYLDPASGRVLDTAEFRNSLVGFMHRFHENLTIPQYSGRAVVGWVGVGMLLLSLSGIYLWWPRTAGFRRGLRWRRAPNTPSNLHHLFGFWIAIPLAIVSATGVYLGFPQQARGLLSSVAPLTPPQRAFNAKLLAAPHIDVDRAKDIAQASVAGTQVAAIFLPTQSSQAWRIQLRVANSEALTTVLVDDHSGALSQVKPQSGDTIAQWMRWVHEGSHSGIIWQILVFLCGVLPTVFAVTGTMIWLRRRKTRLFKSRVSAAPQVHPAE